MKLHQKMIRTIRESVYISNAIDKKSIIYCIIYNLIKQLMNVFYGVFFIRLILESLETKNSIIPILAVIFFMLIINIVYTKFDQYYTNIYLPEFEFKIQCYINERILEAANTIPYDKYNTPENLDKYSRVLDKTVPMIMKTHRIIGSIVGLTEALFLILYYMLTVDVFAICLSMFTLIYSYFFGEINEKHKVELNKALTPEERIQKYAKRIFYLSDYAKELKITSIATVIKKMHIESRERTISIYKTRGYKIWATNFIELLAGDALSVIFPLIYISVRVFLGKQYMIGDLIGLSQAITTFSWDVEWFFDETLELKSATYYVREYLEYCSQQVNESKNKPRIIGDTFHVVFDNVSYKYPNSSRYALKNLTLNINCGEKIAIVGENGAGKTTLVNLLTNLISCDCGTIWLNNININQYKKSDLKNFFGVLTQDYHLYPTTVRDNIAINGKISDVQIWDAIQKMKLDHKITDINSLIGRELSNNGLELSGGEQQKLALTRIIANKYRFVILDEPTSALDAITEKEINKLVLSALPDPNFTLIFISHKMSTTQLVDRILVFDDGKLVEDGDHHQLMNNKGLYHKMYMEQQNMYKGV